MMYQTDTYFFLIMDTVWSAYTRGGPTAMPIEARFESQGGGI